MLSKLVMTMENGEKWEVDVNDITRNKAEYFYSQYPHDYVSFEDARDQILDDFNKDPHMARDWMINNMNWSDLNAVRVFTPQPTDFPEDWMNSEIEYIRVKDEE